MGERKRIGLFFSYDERWIGGSYYILNLVAAIKLLPEIELPSITVFYLNEDDIIKIEELDYPHIEFKKILVKFPLIKRGLNILSRKIYGINLYDFKDKVSDGFYDAIFPLPFRTNFNTRVAKKSFYWIADFQENHLPHLFPAEQIALQKRWYTKVAHSKHHVIFSSYDAKKDFDNAYAGGTVMEHVLQFAVTHPDYAMLDYNTVSEKYKLPEQYFFCPNQFWVHKNHLVILKAVHLLKERFNQSIKIIFSGKEYDYRNADHFSNLKAFVKEKGIEENISFLGFIDRKEQLLIMQHATGIIQPSLFEGWSTVIEDAKAMNQTILASDIAVHTEQLGNQAIYFDPADPDALANVLAGFQKLKIDFHYDAARFKFAKTFLNILSDRDQ